MNYFKERFNKRFVKNGIKAVSFVLIITIILLMLSPVFRPKTNEGLKDKSAQGFLAEPENSIDVLIVGDSLAYSSIIPLKLFNDYGITSYVCGTPSQKLSYTEDFVRRAFKTQKPKLVILETDSIFRRSLPTQTLSLRMEEWAPVFCYHDRWKKISLDDFSFELKNDYVVRDKGYRIFGGVKSPKNEDYKKGMNQKSNVPFFNKYYLESIKKMCEENGAELMFVSIPSIKDWNMDRHNMVEKLSETYDVQYMDMNLMTDEISIDWTSDSRDGGEHLNQAGAEKITSYLGEYLYSKNICNDYRNDERFDSWKEAYSSFLKKVDQIKAEDKKKAEQTEKKTKS